MRGLGLLCGLLAVAAPVAVSAEVAVGVGAFGGVSVPIVQEDDGTGGQFGVRVPVGLLPYLTIEPYFAASSLGDKTESFGTSFEYTRSGFDVDAFGANVLLAQLGTAAGAKFFPYGGIGSHTLERAGSEDATEFGFNLGMGFAMPLTRGFNLDIRGELNTIVTGDTSRKFVNGTAGVSYSILPMGR